MDEWKNRLYSNYVSSGHGVRYSPIGFEGNKKNYYYKNLIKNYIDQNKKIKILDLGCGHGGLLFSLKEEGYTNIIGVDGSREQIDLALKSGLTEVLHVDIADFLTNCDEKFNLIFLMDVLEHFKISEIFELLDNVKKKLDKDGVLIIHIPNGEGLFGMRIRYGDLTHETCFTASSIKQLLIACGYKNFTFIEDVPVIHGFKSFVRNILWNILTMLPRLLLYVETGSGNHILSQNLLVIAK